jgi:hypothetical protein
VGQRSLGCLLLLRLRRLLLGVAAVVAPLLPAGTDCRPARRRPPQGLSKGRGNV